MKIFLAIPLRRVGKKRAYFNISDKMNMSRSLMVRDRIGGFSNRFRSQVNRIRQGVLSARVLFWVGCITTVAGRRRNGWK